MATCLFYTGFTQLSIGTGAQWVVSSNASVVLQDMNLVNNGTINPGFGKFKFTGSTNSRISGTSTSSLQIIEVAKTNNATVQLQSDVNVGSAVVFTIGLLDLGNSKVFLAPMAEISGETETSRTISSGTGYIEINQTINAPNNSNPGNLGAIINSTANLGSVIIRRGHQVSSGTGLSTSITRYYDIIPANNTSLNATLRFNYFDAEKNGLDENNFTLYQSNNKGSSWSKILSTTKNSTSNYVEKAGLSRLSRFTLGLVSTARNGEEILPDMITGNITAQNQAFDIQGIAIQPSFTVGPNPNNGNFFFSVNEIKDPVSVQLFTIDGKMIRKFTMQRGYRQAVNGLSNGVYILKASGVEPFKILVQGSNHLAPVSGASLISF